MAALEQNLKYLYTQLVNNGLNKFLAAGITTNAYRECAGNPNVMTIDGKPKGGNLATTPADSHGIGGGYIGFYYHGRLKDLFKYASSNNGVLNQYSGKSLNTINTEIESWLMEKNGGSIPQSAFYDGGVHLKNGPYYNKFIVTPTCQVQYIAHIMKSEFTPPTYSGDEAMHQYHNWFFKEVERAATSVEQSWQRYGEKTKRLINDAAIASQLTNTTIDSGSDSTFASGDEMGETWSGNVYSGTYELDLANATVNNLLNLDSVTSNLNNTSLGEKTIKRVYTYKPKNAKMVQLVPMQLDYSSFITSDNSKV